MGLPKRARNSYERTGTTIAARKAAAKVTKLRPPRCRDPYSDREKRARVLIADDDPDMRELLAQTLRDEGYEVVDVDDGSEVIKRLAYNHSDIGPLANVDVIVSDVCMPILNGLEVLKNLRKKDWATSVILISAFADDAVRAEAKRMGAAAVLSKPFALKDLVYAVRSVVPAA